MEPPDPIPNSEVKRLIANGSVGFPHVRVGHRQVSIQNAQLFELGVLLCEKRKQQNQGVTLLFSGDFSWLSVNSAPQPIINIHIRMFGRYRELLFYRAHAELTRDLKRAYLGVLWWFIEPALYMAVFYIVFGIGLRKGGPDFVVYLLTGLIVWKWLDGTVKSSSNVIISSVGLMNHVYLPKLILPGMVVVVNTYKLITVLVIFLIFLVFVWGIPATHYWQALPLLLLLQLILICGMAGLAAAVVPIIPDLKYVIDYGMTLAFFMSGIFFDIHDVTPEIQHLLMYNPMVVLIESYRDVLLYARWPDWHALLIVVYEAATTFALMLVLLIKLDRYYPRVVG